MKRRLVSKNKSWFSKKFKRLAIDPVSKFTFAYIAEVKRRGQRAYERRLLKNRHYNARQYKKYQKACELRQTSSYSIRRHSNLVHDKARFK
tara:strand:- start:2385 stop:2657 length:273 start_codon:yes stop_codon:yes gene_type:complete